MMEGSTTPWIPYDPAIKDMFVPSGTPNDQLIPFSFESPKYIKISGSINFFVQPEDPMGGSGSPCDPSQLLVGC